MSIAAFRRPQARFHPVRRIGLHTGLLWLLACVLVLRAAVPLLASASALLQGVPVAEVCAVYGVVVPPTEAEAPAGSEHAHHAHHAHHAQHDQHAGPGAGGGEHGSHANEHCALTALSALCTSAAPDRAAEPAHGASALRLALPAQAAFVNPAARWQAQLQHGPPRQA